MLVSLLLRTLDWLSTLYGALLNTHLFLRSLNICHPVRDIGDDLLPLVVRPAPALLALALLRRQPMQAALHLPGSLQAAALLMRCPQPPQAIGKEPALRLLTLNMGQWRGQGPEIMALLAGCDADLVAIQELRAPLAELVVAGLRERFPYQVIRLAPDRYGGHAVLSRFPLHDVELLRLTPDGFNHLRAVVEWPAAPFAFYSVHPPHAYLHPPAVNTHVRRKDLLALMAHLHAETAPVILAGDWNMPDTSRDYRIIASTLIDAYRTAGSGYGATWPDFRPWHLPGMRVIRLDYVFHSPHFAAEQAAVLPSVRSDHRPLTVTLRLCAKP